MERVRFQIHKSTNILFLDFSDISKVDEITPIIKYARGIIDAQPLGSLYVLTDMTNMHFGPGTKDEFQKFIHANKPRIKSSAVVGLTGMKKILFDSVIKLTGRDIKTFSQQAEAMEWLAGKN